MASAEMDTKNAISGGRAWKVPKSITPMWKEQQKLPRLPVPDLYKTCMRYLRSVRPLLTDEEFEKTKDAVVEFAIGKGPHLQAQLLKRASDKKDSSWLIDWWNDYAYLTDPSPVVFFVSYYYAFKDFRSFVRPIQTTQNVQCAVAASLVSHALSFREIIISGDLSPDMAQRRGQCMSQYAFLFESCRIPSPPQDHVVTYPLRPFTHVAVLRKNRIVRVDISLEGGSISAGELEQGFLRAVEMTNSSGLDEWGVGVLTSDGREEWAKARAALLNVDGDGARQNAQALLAVQSAALVVCLDDEQLPDGEAGVVSRARNCWHGNGQSRFFDKTLQFIVMPDGRAGFLGEHAISDGSPTARMCDWILSRITKPATISPGIGGVIKSVSLQPVRVNDAVKVAIRASQERFDKIRSSHHMAVMTMEGFGRGGIKALGIAPDAFLQMGMQLAFYNMAGRMAPTYEACSTRRFLHGRTETIRSCSIEAAQFVKKMNDELASDESKHAALDAAVNQHRLYAALCSSAQGVDRHLLGLKMLVPPGTELPNIFKDAAYDATRAWELSTSTLSCEMFESWGFGEVVPYGFGIGYTQNQGETTFVVTCRSIEGQADSGKRGAILADNIKKSLESMKSLCQRVNPTLHKSKL